MEEVLDSEEEDEDSLDGTQSTVQTQVVSATVKPTQLLHQLTLPELLKPQQQSSSSPSVSTYSSC